MWTEEREQIGYALRNAIDNQDNAAIRLLCTNNPWLICAYRWDGNNTWLLSPARKGFFQTVKTLIELGFDVNTLDYPTTSRSTALVGAIGDGHFEVARLLLENGADPNLSRPLISAINLNDDDLAMRCVRLLVENGIDVNQVFLLYNNPNDTFTALDWAKSRPAIAKYLRENGAKTAAELKTSPVAKQKSAKTKTPAQEVIDNFANTVGPVDEKSLIEIMPTGQPISVHIVPPFGTLQHLTLFTTGLSDQPMTVPDGEEDFAYAELFIELPGDWDYRNTKAKKWNWPMRWLRQIAQYPSANDTWLNQPITIIANGNPAKPIIPGTIFTCLLLVPEKSFERSDGNTLQLYRMLPITTAERDLERAKGAKALMRALDKAQVPFIVDITRESVV
jgi:uncharacterized protein